jgi:hypothetical protein
MQHLQRVYKSYVATFIKAALLPLCVSIFSFFLKKKRLKRIAGLAILFIFYNYQWQGVYYVFLISIIISHPRWFALNQKSKYETTK